MKQIKKDWNKIYRLSKVTLKEDLKTCCMAGEVILKAGTYFISGFWADAMGLTKTLKDARDLNNKWLIPSRDLENFYR